jgi:hypothetical protein
MNTPQRIAVALCSLPKETLMTSCTNRHSAVAGPACLGERRFTINLICVGICLRLPNIVAISVTFQVSLEVNRTSTSLETNHIAQRRTQEHKVRILTAHAVHNDSVAGWQLPHILAHLCQVGAGNGPPHCCVGRSRPARRGQC